MKRLLLAALIVAASTAAQAVEPVREQPNKGTLKCHFYENAKARQLAGEFSLKHGFNRQATLAYAEFDQEILQVSPNSLICIDCWIMGLRIYANPTPDHYINIDLPGEFSFTTGSGTTVGTAVIRRKDQETINETAVCEWKLEVVPVEVPSSVN